VSPGYSALLVPGGQALPGVSVYLGRGECGIRRSCTLGGIRGCFERYQAILHSWGWEAERQEYRAI
jgi:hypothetical protein